MFDLLLIISTEKLAGTNLVLIWCPKNKTKVQQTFSQCSIVYQPPRSEWDPPENNRPLPLT